MASGWLVFVSVETGEVLGQTQIEVRSSDRIEVKGGVGIKLGPVKVGNVGGTEADEALRADFTQNISKAVVLAVERLKK